MASNVEELVLGAVAYDPKVVTFWDGFREWLRPRGLPLDCVFFTSYERQVEAHFSGLVHLCWNSPLAWMATQRLAQKRGRTARAIAMGDADRDQISVILVRSESKLQKLLDLRGKRLGIGAKDSPQATLIPLVLLLDAGLQPGRDFEALEHDLVLGRHGAHPQGERAAACALLRGEVDAVCLLAANHLGFSGDGTLPPEGTRVIARTPAYDLRNITALDGAPEKLVASFQKLLLEASYEDSVLRRLFDLEGLRSWKPGRTTGYGQIERAVDRFRFLDAWLSTVQPQNLSLQGSRSGL